MDSTIPKKRSYPKGEREITNHSIREGCDVRQTLNFLFIYFEF